MAEYKIEIDEDKVEAAKIALLGVGIDTSFEKLEESKDEVPEEAVSAEEASSDVEVTSDELPEGTATEN